MAVEDSEEDYSSDEAVKRPRRAIIYLGIAALSIGILALAFLRAGSWLVVQDPLQPARAIVVLSGSMPVRAMEAAQIYRQDVSSQIWVSQGLSPGPELEAMHIAYLGEDFYNQKVLMAMGVPADAIHILEDPSANTEEEVRQIARDLHRDDAHTVIIVTSKAHTRRVRYIWKKVVGNDPKLIVRYAENDTFDPAHWWRTSTDALQVVREYLGLANAWAGFPAHPEAH